MNGMPADDNPSGRSSAPARPVQGPRLWWPALLYALVSQATQAAGADRGRAALLAAVSHDLRTPLAAAKAAVSGLRSGDVFITTNDRDELLATADESLDQLVKLAASLLDVSRLQAGAQAVFPQSADLRDIVADSLDGLGPLGLRIIIDIPSGLPEVMADPAITERVIGNLLNNALRYSPPTSPPLLRARARGDRVEVRVVDHGPGIPEADRKRAFLPFCRLDDPDSRSGVGLGLAVSRGLAEAMGSTVEPEETPGGGLTMVVSLPAAPAVRAENTHDFDPDWRDDAACRHHDPELFFPKGTAGPALVQADQAKRVCQSCPVRAPCLKFALRHGLTSGIWGGATGEERRHIRRAVA